MGRRNEIIGVLNRVSYHYHKITDSLTSSEIFNLKFLPFFADEVEFTLYI